MAHCDVTPENVMVETPKQDDAELVIKLANFGKAVNYGLKKRVMVEWKGGSFDRNAVDISATTAGYASPEWLLEMPNKEESIDLWSATVTVLEAVLGKRLYTATHDHPIYSQLAAIWHFSVPIFPLIEFYLDHVQANSKHAGFFTRDGLAFDGAPPQRRTGQWRLKKLWEVTDRFDISPAARMNPEQKWSSWCVNSVKEIVPKHAPGDEQLLKQFHTLLENILLFNPAARIGVQAALDDPFFRPPVVPVVAEVPELPVVAEVPVVPKVPEDAPANLEPREAPKVNLPGEHSIGS